MAAFELALDQGAQGIEFDVHLSADGIPVVIHDAWLGRTTDGRGWVHRLTAAGLMQLDAGSWFNRRYPARARSHYAGLRIPLLAEVLELVRRRKCYGFIEIKAGGERYPGIEEKVLAEIHRSGTLPFATVISFDWRTLLRARELDAKISLGIDFTRPVQPLRRARSIAVGTLLPHSALASRRFIQKAHQAGLRVVVWGLDQPLWMERKVADGVDGIVTRYPGRLRAILAGLEPTRAPEAWTAGFCSRSSKRALLWNVRF